MKKLFITLATVLLAAGLAPAQEPPQSQAPPPQSQAPSASQEAVQIQPGVARVSFTHGEVSTQHGDTGEWLAVTLNTPITVGDRVATGKGSRAELQLDYANILRMADEATAKVANLSRSQMQLQIGQGLVNFSVLPGSEADVEIDTPNVGIHPTRGEGSYRILVNSDSETIVVVRKGEADLSTPQGTTHITEGQQITIQGTDNPQYQTVEATGRDDFDKWNNDRDKLISNAESWRHTDRYYTGTQDLDTYGHWSNIPDYGPVWTPAVAPGWAPYREGRWVWEPYWGWTWVSYEPWGWAPYHYGRWFVYGGSWVWWPGPVVASPAYYPVWAPAYVSFFGFGGRGFGIGIGFGFGSVGWLPIGPCDPFFPWWGGFGSRVTVINIRDFDGRRDFDDRRDFGRDGREFGRGDARGFDRGPRSMPPLASASARRFSNLDGARSDSRIREGISSMPANQFGQSRVPSHQQPISANTFHEGSMMTGAVPATPTRESARSTDRTANPGSVPARAMSTQHFFSNSRVAANAGASNSRISGNSTMPASRAIQGSRSGASAGPQGSAQSGWHTFNSPNQGRSAQSQNAARPQNPVTTNRPSFSAPQRGQVQPSGSPQQLGSRSNAPAPSAPSQNQSGWQHFTPQPRQAQPQPAGRNPGNPGSIQPSSSRSRPAQTYSRPPLNLRQPIVTPRSSSYPQGGSRGNSAPRSAPRSSGGGGGHSSGGHSGGGGHSSGGHGH